MSDAEKDMERPSVHEAPFPVEQDHWYAVTDSDWGWDSTDDGDGAPFITLASSPLEAAKKAAAHWGEQQSKEGSFAWGVHMKICRLSLEGFVGVDIEADGTMNVDEFQKFSESEADTITTLRAEVERLTEERETIFMDIVDERDAAIARAEKAEAALAKMRDHYDNVDMSHEAFRVMASVEADKVLGGRYEAEAVAFVESLTEGE